MNASESPSGSDAVSVIGLAVSWGVVTAWALATGGSLTGVMVRLIVATLLSTDPSLVLNVKLSEPL